MRKEKQYFRKSVLSGICSICGIRPPRETKDQYPKSYDSAADGGAASVMVVQAYMGATISITTNACEDALPRCLRVVFFPSSTILLGGKPPFLLSSLQPTV